jgi:hypothetical protein
MKKTTKTLERSTGPIIEPNSTYRKWNEAAHMVLVDHLISQSGLDLSPIWTPFIAA